MLDAEKIGSLQRLIATLPTKLRDPLTLSTVEEISPKDIAQVLGTSKAAVRSRIFCARQILRTSRGHDRCPYRRRMVVEAQPRRHKGANFKSAGGRYP